MAWAAPFDPFEALGLKRETTPRIIKSRYRELARRYHPNRNQGTDQAKAALSEQFHNIHQAWRLLSQDDSRRRCVEVLDLYDLHETVVDAATDLLNAFEQIDPPAGQRDPSKEGHISSDADDDDEDLPRLGLKKRLTFDDAPSKGPGGLENIEEGSESNGRNKKPERKGRSRLSQLRGKTAGSGRDDEGSGSETNKTSQRRKKLDRLRKKELQDFFKYRDAMIDKFEAEEAAVRCKEQYEQAKWRREYFERAPKDASQRMRMIRLFSAASKAFMAQNEALKQTRRSSITYGGQILSPLSPQITSANNIWSPADKSEKSNNFLALPSRIKSIHRRGYSSDISGDQTSSDEEDSSDKATSPNRSPRRTSPRPNYSRHRKVDSIPSILPVSSSRLPNGNHEPMSPISGPGPQVFVRTPTNLSELIDDHDHISDADSTSQVSKNESTQFRLVTPRGPSDMFVGGQERQSRSPSPERRSSPDSDSRAHGPSTPPNDSPIFKIKQIGQPKYEKVATECVHDISHMDKKSMLSAESDPDSDPKELLWNLARLDTIVADRFMVKPDIMAEFNFRLIYSHREVVRQQRHSFIALSYRRKLHVEKRKGHFTLPLDPEMFQAVWDERHDDHEGVWIDQVCIKGDSEVEQRVSMAAMSSVYRSARVVVVALDDIRLEAHEGEILDNHMKDFVAQVHVPATKRFRRRQTPYLESHRDLSKAIQKILRSSWFQRAWCRHEMRLAREHIFLVPCRNRNTTPGKSVLRFTGKCMAHLLGLATEVALEAETEAVKPALYAFFRDRTSKLSSDRYLRSHHGNFTTVVAEVFAMQAGGDPKIPEEQRASDARKDQISIILNTMECGLALHPSVRDPEVPLPTFECNYMLLLLALAARDPGALCSVGRPMRKLPYELASSWLFEPTNVDSGLNNYRTLNRLPKNFRIKNSYEDDEHFIQLDMKFLKPGKVSKPCEAPDTVKLAEHFIKTCENRKIGRGHKRYLLTVRKANDLFGSMRDVYVDTFVCIFECGPDWMSDVCHRYGVSRYKHDLQPAYDLMVALKNTNGKWPETAWSNQAAGFIMDFVNFLIIRGLPQRQLGQGQREEWRPVWVSPPVGGKVLTFVPPGDIRVAIPAALLDPDYNHLARLWVLEPREEHDEEDATPDFSEWTLRGKSVLFSDDVAIELMKLDNGFVRQGLKVFGRKGSNKPTNVPVGMPTSLPTMSIPRLQIETS